MSSFNEISDIIWSPYTDGHHPMYLRVLLESMAACTTRKVLIVVGADIVHDVRWPILLEKLEAVGGQYILLDFDGKHYTCDSLSGQIKQRKLLVALLSRYKCNRLYIPFCDSIWLSLYLFGLPARSCNSLWLLWMRNQSHLPVKAIKRIAEMLKLRAARVFMNRYNAVNFTVDPCFFEWAASQEGTQDIFKYIPEPVLDLCKDQVSDQFGAELKKCITILAIGMLDDRKDVGKLIDAFVGLEPGKALLRLVGTLSESCLQHIEGLPPVIRKMIIIHNQVVTDEVYCAELSSADIIWNVRSTHLLSSGTLAHAIANHKVVICSSEGCTGYWGRKYKKAILCLDNPLEALKSALNVVEDARVGVDIVADDQISPFALSWAGYI